MLLDDLLAKREHAEPHAGGATGASTPDPVLTIEPVAVPPTGEIGRRAARQRLAALEDAARRNLRSAEEARRVLADEHRRLQEESCARMVAEDEVAALRRELDRLRESERGRTDQVKTYAARTAHAEIAAEHDRVVGELDRLQGSLRDHDGLLEDYAQRLRDEQEARAALRAELEQAETARRLAERSVERTVESARKHAEDEVIRLATAEAALADALSDRDRLAARVEALEADDGPSRRRISELEEEVVRARADGDRLRAHAAALGDELAAVRATVAELQAAAPAPTPIPLPELVASEPPAPERPPLARRRPRTERQDPPGEASVGGGKGDDSAATEGERSVESIRKVRPLTDASPSAPEPVAEPTPAAVSEPDVLVPAGFRRTAMAELTAIASASEADDFTFRRQ